MKNFKNYVFKQFFCQFGTFFLLCYSIYSYIHRPGTAITHASNMCAAVGGDQNKAFRGNASFLREKIYCYRIFHIKTRKPKIISIRSNDWYTNLFFVGLISHQSFIPFPSTSMGALALFTFLPQCTVHNLRIWVVRSCI